MHRVLERQIKRFLGVVKVDELDPKWRALLESISVTYDHADEDRRLLTHSLELSSKEFVALNKKLRDENSIVEEKVRERTQDLEHEKKNLLELQKNIMERQNELERINNLMVNRELRMVELKQRIQELESQSKDTLVG